MYCNQEIETMSRPKILQLQTERLQKTIRWAAEKSAFYKKKMEHAGLSYQSIRSLEDLASLPFTTKKELAAAHFADLLTGPISGTIRMRMVGAEQPVTRAYTGGDVARNVEMMARCLVAGGVNRASVLEVAEEYANENALNVQCAAELLGATVVPSAGMKLERVLEMADQLGVTMLSGNSQQFLQLLVAGQTLEYDLSTSGIKTLFSLNDTVKNNMESHLMSRFEARMFNFYAPPEFGCSGVAFECAEKRGMHLQEDYFYPEVISMTDHQPLAYDRVGELVLTSLAFEAMPILRFRTGQIVSMNQELCRCGRTLFRIDAR